MIEYLGILGVGVLAFAAIWLFDYFLIRLGEGEYPSLHDKGHADGSGV